MWSGSGVPGKSTTSSGKSGSREGMPESSGVRPPRGLLAMPEGGLGRAPHPVEALHVGGLAQLLEGALADLADPFTGDAEQLADALEGEGVGALFEAVIEIE